MIRRTLLVHPAHPKGWGGQERDIMTKWDDAKREINHVFATRRGHNQDDILNAAIAAFEQSGQRLTEVWRKNLSDLARTASHGGNVTLR